jgi:predicted dehydrogenase
LVAVSGEVLSVKILVLGFGSMGRRHALNAMNLGHDVLVYDPGAEPLEGVKLTESEEAGWGWGPTAVVIATPARTHAAILQRAWDLKLPVLVEKPLATTVGDFQRLPPRETLTWVGYNLRFHQGVRHVLRRDLPRLGRVLYGRFNLHCNKDTWPGKDYAETLLECSHEIDLAQWVMGRCRLGGATTIEKRIWHILLTHEGGTISTVQIDDRWSAEYRRGAEIVGEGGWVRWAMNPSTGQFKAKTSWDSSYSRDTTAEETYRKELEAFCEAVEGRGHPDEVGCSLAEAFDVLRLCDAAALDAKIAQAGQ